ncbi:hypothetical protein BGZ76_001584 [Entomortierella beljakovae]|nr:hypothetical protein BGZ76_001584 [Entomortierella beljakovae]
MTFNTIDPSLLDELRPLESKPRETRQGFRVVYRNEHSSLTFKQQQDIVYITPEYDPELERNVIRWKLIEEKFENALFIQKNFKAIPFIQGYDSKILLPFRINTVLDVILDVIVENPIDVSDNVTESPKSSRLENLMTREYKCDKSNTVLNLEVDQIPRSSNLMDDRNTLHDSYQNSDDLDFLQCKGNQRGRNLALAKAESGNAEAQTDIGILYTIFMADHSKAIEWIFKAANQGFARAQRNIGYHYCMGYGVTKDLSISMEWYLKAAEQNDPVGQNGLGAIYDDGIGVNKDYSKALEWYLKSAGQGYASAYRNIGNLYYHGHGVSQDYSKALEWYIKAAKRGCTIALTSIGVLYSNGHGVTKDLSKALEWFLKASEQGDKLANLNIGLMYLRGTVGKADYPKALEYFTEAANEGDLTSMFCIGQIYRQYYSLGSRDYPKALEWFLKAGSQGHASSQNAVGDMYYNGQGVPKDYLKAQKWYLKAASQGNSSSQIQAGLIYYYGFGTPLNYTNALEMLLKAANQDSSIAQQHVISLYEKGYGTPVDFAKAMEWVKKIKTLHQSHIKKISKIEKKQIHLDVEDYFIEKDPETLADIISKGWDGLTTTVVHQDVELRVLKLFRSTVYTAFLHLSVLTYDTGEVSSPASLDRKNIKRHSTAKSKKHGRRSDGIIYCRANKTELYVIEFGGFDHGDTETKVK